MWVLHKKYSSSRENFQPMAVKKITSPKNYLLATVFHVESFTFRDDHVYDKRQTPNTTSRLSLTIFLN